MSRSSDRVRLKRVYEPPGAADGCRVLVDRLWPRSMSKKEARIDVWLREIAPSPGLRKWFAHDPAKWPEFRRRYCAELERNRAAVERLLALVRRGPITLVFAASDTEHNNAVVLREYVQRQLEAEQRRGGIKPQRVRAERV